MAAIEQSRVLAPLTTMGVGGPADAYMECATVEELRQGIEMARAGNVPLFILGGGSNVVIADEGFRGLVLRPVMRGISLLNPTTDAELATPPSPSIRSTGSVESTPSNPTDPSNPSNPSYPSNPAPPSPAANSPATIIVRVGAGEPWDSVVAWTVERGLAGLEALSGIPGLAGASPIQNIGAYGQEVARVIDTVEALDRETGQVVRVPGRHCGFAYRDSRFKTGPDAGRYVVAAVEFRLEKQTEAPARYAELRSRLVAEGHDPDAAPLAAIRAAVLALRRSKGMVLDPADPDTRSCGSFFTNPILAEANWPDFVSRCAAAGMLSVGSDGSPETPPKFPAGPGHVKTSAAWLIERSGFGKGFALPAARPGTAALSTKHCLALTNRGGALAREIWDLAHAIQAGVREKTGVTLVPEPVFVGK